MIKKIITLFIACCVIHAKHATDENTYSSNMTVEAGLGATYNRSIYDDYSGIDTMVGLIFDMSNCTPVCVANYFSGIELGMKLYFAHDTSHNAIIVTNNKPLEKEGKGTIVNSVRTKIYEMRSPYRLFGTFNTLGKVGIGNEYLRLELGIGGIIQRYSYDKNFKPSWIAEGINPDDRDIIKPDSISANKQEKINLLGPNTSPGFTLFGGTAACALIASMRITNNFSISTKMQLSTNFIPISDDFITVMKTIFKKPEINSPVDDVILEYGIAGALIISMRL